MKKAHTLFLSSKCKLWPTCTQI